MSNTTKTVKMTKTIDGDTVTSVTRNTYQVYKGASPTTSNRMEMRIREIEDLLDAERDHRMRLERQNVELNMVVDNLSEQLEEAGGITHTQTEITRKRDVEVTRLRKDLDLSNTQLEQTEASMRKRNQEAIADLSDQLEHLTKLKNRLDKEKSTLLIEIDQMQSQYENAHKGQLTAESRADGMEAQLDRMKSQNADLNRQLLESNSAKNKLGQDNFDLQAALADLQTAHNNVLKIKISLSAQYEDAKRTADDEGRQRAALQSAMAALQADYDNLAARLGEEEESNVAMKAKITSLTNELSSLRTRYDRDLSAKNDECEELKRRLTIRISELTQLLEAAQAKVNSLEKSKSKCITEIRELNIEIENISASNGELAKRLKDMERANGELAARVGDLDGQLNVALSDNRKLNEVNGRLRAQVDDLGGKNDNLSRENKALTDKLRDTESLLKDANRMITELSQIKITLESERASLAQALGDAENANADLEARLRAAQDALNAVKAELERRLREKEDELEALRKNSQRTVEELQRTVVEMETRYRSEMSRIKKKLETEIRELEITIETLQKNNVELQRVAKGAQTRVKELEIIVLDIEKSMEECRIALNIAEKRRMTLTTELDEMRAKYETAERGRKNAEGEREEATNRVSELSISITMISNDKRRLEGDLTALQSEHDDAKNNEQAALDRADRLQNDLNRVSDELKMEHDNYRNAEGLRKQLEVEIREISIRLEEAETWGAKEGKRLMAKFQSRIRDLEAELEAEQRRHREANSSARKAERQFKELLAQSEEDRRMMLEFQETNATYANKIKMYKRQLEEAEQAITTLKAHCRRLGLAAEEADYRAQSLTSQIRQQQRSKSVTRAIIKASQQPQEEMVEIVRVPRGSSLRRVFETVPETTDLYSAQASSSTIIRTQMEEEEE